MCIMKKSCVDFNFGHQINSFQLHFPHKHFEAVSYFLKEKWAYFLFSTPWQYLQYYLANYTCKCPPKVLSIEFLINVSYSFHKKQLWVKCYQKSVYTNTFPILDIHFNYATQALTCFMFLNILPKSTSPFITLLSTSVLSYFHKVIIVVFCTYFC